MTPSQPRAGECVDNDQERFDKAWQGPMWNGCGSCNFVRRAMGRPYCAWCREEIAQSLANLAANLRVTVALCAAFELAWWGRMRYSDQGKSAWRPNVLGMTAPGFEEAP